MQSNWLYFCPDATETGRTQRKAATINQLACPSYSLTVALLWYPMYYPRGMKARVGPVQWSKPYSINWPHLRTRTRATGFKITWWPLHYHGTPITLLLHLKSSTYHHIFSFHIFTTSALHRILVCHLCMLLFWQDIHNSQIKYNLNTIYSKKFSWMSFIALHYSTASEEICWIQRVFPNPSRLRLVRKDIQPPKTRSNIPVDRQPTDGG